MSGIVRPAPGIASASETAETRMRPLGVPARALLGVLFVAGAIVAVPSGVGLFWFVPYAGVGTLLAIRRPGTSIGWILIALSWAVVLTASTIDATAAQFDEGNMNPVTAGVAIVDAQAGYVEFYLLALLSIVFPTGRLPARRWGTVARVALGLVLAVGVAAIFMPKIPVNLPEAPTSVGVRNPVAAFPELPIWQLFTPDTVIIPFVVLLAGSVVSLLVRYRRATGLERQQLRWIAAALGLVIAGVLAGFIISAAIPGASESGVAWIGPIIAIPCVPIAIGIAVLRYRLYEIDRIISRTISWALSSGLIAALFAGLIVALQALLAPLTSESSLAVAGSTLVAAAVFQPVRRRIQAAVDHRFNRRRYDAERIVDAYAAQLRGVTDLDAIEAGAVDAVARSLGPSGAGVWIRPTGGAM